MVYPTIFESIINQCCNFSIICLPEKKSYWHEIWSLKIQKIQIFIFLFTKVLQIFQMISLIVGHQFDFFFLNTVSETCNYSLKCNFFLNNIIKKISPVSGCKCAKLAPLLKDLIETDNFKVSVVDDVDTVEICGALKV